MRLCSYLNCELRFQNIKHTLSFLKSLKETLSVITGQPWTSQQWNSVITSMLNNTNFINAHQRLIGSWRLNFRPPCSSVRRHHVVRVKSEPLGRTHTYRLDSVAQPTNFSTMCATCKQSTNWREGCGVEKGGRGCLVHVAERPREEEKKPLQVQRDSSTPRVLFLLAPFDNRDLSLGLKEPLKPVTPVFVLVFLPLILAGVFSSKLQTFSVGSNWRF